MVRTYWRITWVYQKDRLDELLRLCGAKVDHPFGPTEWEQHPRQVLENMATLKAVK